MKIGAHMTGLRRVRAGIFFEKNCVTKEKFEEAVEEFEKGNEKLLKEIIIPAEIVSEVYLSVEVKEDNVEQLFHGSPLHEEFIVAKDKGIKENQIVCVFCKSKFIGMYNTQRGKIFAQPQFVLQPIKLIKE
jgi:tRNA U55 pseudouridine synthase TruB